MKLFLIATIMIIGYSSSAQSLEQFQWKNRLVVFLGEPNEENQKRLEDYASLDKELEERKLMILQATESGLVQLYPKATSIHKHSNTYKTLRKKFPNETALLIGLDGGVKRKTQLLFEPKDLFGIIDAMPMRASEIRRKNE